MNKFVYVLRVWGRGSLSWVTFTDVKNVHDIEVHRNAVINMKWNIFQEMAPGIDHYEADGLIIEIEEQVLSDYMIKDMQGDTVCI